MRTSASLSKAKSQGAVGMRASFELTVPSLFRKKLTPGEFFRVEQVGSELVLRPVDALDPSQAWFWTSGWQRKEQEADKDIKAGRISGPFRNANDFMRGLKR